MGHFGSLATARSLQPPNSLVGQFWPQIWNQWPQLPTYPCAYCLYGTGPYGSLRGHHSLQTASEIKSDLWFQISDLIDICSQSFKVSLLVKKWLYWQEKMTNRGPWPAYKATRHQKLRDMLRDQLVKIWAYFKRHNNSWRSTVSLIEHTECTTFVLPIGCQAFC